MARTPHRWLYVLLVILCSARLATAQALGTLTWQLQPFCNVLTLTVTQVSGAFTLTGFDDRCSQGARAPATGAAVLNADGTIGLGVTVVIPSGHDPVHIDATIDNMTTLQGPWHDTVGNRGLFAFSASTGGPPRPLRLSETTLAGTDRVPTVLGVKHTGIETAPSATADDAMLLSVGGGGYSGTAFTGPRAAMVFRATQAWTPSANGAQIEFHLTHDDHTSMAKRMVLNEVGLGLAVASPSSLLDVWGDIKIGQTNTGCVRDRDATIIAGICSSDVRFKRDITPFTPLLDRVSGLQPAHFFWKRDEFPEKAFGERESFGLVAQDVERVMPELVTIDEDGYKAVNYSKLPLLAIQAIKELKEKNDALERRLAAIEGAFSRLSAERDPR